MRFRIIQDTFHQNVGIKALFPLSPQYTRNHLRHHGDHRGQWAEPTSPDHALLPHGLASGPNTNPTPPGRRRAFIAQQLRCAQSEHDERWHHHRALQRPLGPLQVCVQRPAEASGSGWQRGGAGGECSRREADGGGRVRE